jgi:hypothetical protein
MGMYTEFETNLLLKKETPTPVITMLQYMVMRREPKLMALFTEKDHALFGNERYTCVLNFNNCSCNNYEKPTLTRTEEGWRLTSNSEFKNYGDPISLFLDWIRPFVVKGFLEDGAVARKLYEEFNTSTYIHLDAIGYKEETEPEDYWHGYGY